MSNLSYLNKLKYFCNNVSTLITGLYLKSIGIKHNLSVFKSVPQTIPL